MRVSSNQYHITVNASLQNSNAQLEKLIGQMASGNRLTRPSDDPIAHVRIARLQREEASIAQYKDNIGALSSRMTQSETVLSSINSDMRECTRPVGLGAGRRQYRRRSERHGHKPGSPA